MEKKNAQNECIKHRRIAEHVKSDHRKVGRQTDIKIKSKTGKGTYVYYCTLFLMSNLCIRNKFAHGVQKLTSGVVRNCLLSILNILFKLCFHLSYGVKHFLTQGKQWCGAGLKLIG